MATQEPTKKTSLVVSMEAQASAALVPASRAGGFLKKKRSRPTTLLPHQNDIFGFKVLSNPPTAGVDICFVHGLTGGRYSTWACEDADPDEQYWPLLLASHFPQARVLTYGYDADVVRIFEPTNGNGLRNYAQSMLMELDCERYDDPQRPLVFIAHSLGGLVVEEMLLASLEPKEERFRLIADSTCGIMFFGTPHRGASLANWGLSVLKILRLFHQVNDRVVSVLQKHSDVLRSVEDRFQQELIHDGGRLKNIKITCFFEAHPTSGLDYIVSEDSATLPGYTNQSLDADHKGMTKFKFGAEDPGFKKVKGQLRDCIKRAKALPTANDSRAQQADARIDPSASVHSNMLPQTTFTVGQNKGGHVGNNCSSGSMTSNYNYGTHHPS